MAVRSARQCPGSLSYCDWRPRPTPRRCCAAIRSRANRTSRVGGISIKREPNGAAGTYVQARVHVGDVIDASTPRGAFTLKQGDGPVVLLSAGIGLTPVLAMLQALAAGGSRRDIWWVHGPRNKAEHALAAEVQGLLKLLPRGHSRILYSAPAPSDRLAIDFDGAGRVDVHVLQALGAPREADFYLCGPAVFMSSLTADLASWGVPAERLHSENFGSEPSLTPGVVATPLRPPHLPDRPAGRADGVFRQKQFGPALGSGVSEPSGTGRGLRRAGAVGVSHRRLPQLRNRTYRWRSRLFRRAAYPAGRRRSPDLLQPAPRRCCARSVKRAWRRTAQRR